MTIKAKLILSFSVVTILLATVGFVSIKATRDELKHSISNLSVSIVKNSLDKIDREIYSRIEDCQEFPTRPLIQRAVAESNADFDAKSDVSGYIKQSDDDWINTGADQLSPLMQTIIGHERSEDLRYKIEMLEKNMVIRYIPRFS